MERPAIDYRNPDYIAIYRWRADALARIRQADERALAGLRSYYSTHPADFISDWGMTRDPRNLDRDLPAVFPFVLWPKQREWIEWVYDHWKNRKPGLTEKSRDEGLSWLAVSIGCTLCLFHQGMSLGYGSRKEEYVDKLGEPRSLFAKARFFMDYIPVEFKGDWNIKRDAPYMRIRFPATDSNMSGEAGDNIGRGDRQAIYFVDESPLLENPKSVDAALSQTTNCRMDIGTPRGMANTFAEKRHSGKIDVFTFHWRDDPRKDDAWYEKQKSELDEIIIAQEIDIDYAASATGILIPAAWARAAKDAHLKLGLQPTGVRKGGMDVADEGSDLCAFAGLRGFLLDHLEEWSGKGGDIFGSVERAFSMCDEIGLTDFAYDADGLGAGVRGDARVINEQRRGAGRPTIEAHPHWGAGEVADPEAEDVAGRTNADFFANRKAQSWWRVRRCFELTYRWVVEGKPCSPDDIISISGRLPLADKLISEIAQVTYRTNTVGKVLVDKAPNGVKSPNLADAVVIAKGGPVSLPLAINAGVLARSRMPMMGNIGRPRLT